MAERSARRRKPSKPYAQVKAEIHAKNPTEIGITGGAIPKKDRSAAKQYEFEKKRRENIGPNIGGIPYQTSPKKHVASATNYNPRTRTFEEFMIEVQSRKNLN